jgi:hypothetical protein
MSSFRDTLKNAFIKAIGKRADYDIILAAAEWVKRGTFVEADVVEIQAAIDAQYQIIEEETENIIEN